MEPVTVLSVVLQLFCSPLPFSILSSNSVLSVLGPFSPCCQEARKVGAAHTPKEQTSLKSEVCIVLCICCQGCAACFVCQR